VKSYFTPHQHYEDQVPGIANHNGISEQSSDAAFKYKAIFVLAMMSVHGSCQSTWLHWMLYKRKTFAGVCPFDHKAGWCLPILRDDHHSGRVLLVLSWVPCFTLVIRGADNARERNFILCLSFVQLRRMSVAGHQRP
jgi:hypothetical protein